MQIRKGLIKMARQSRSSKVKQTAKGRSQTPSQTQQNSPKIKDRTQMLQNDLSMLSDDQLTKATLIAQRLAMQDALSMLQRKRLQYEMMQSS